MPKVKDEEKDTKCIKCGKDEADCECEKKDGRLVF